VAQVSLKDRVVIVTGSGAGLGRAYALDMARRGAAVVVNDLSRERADAVVTEIEGAGGRAAVSYDSVAEAEPAAAIVATALDAFGTLDAIVCNAGTMKNGYFEELGPGDLEAMLAVHVGGCWYPTQAAWPVFRGKGYGRIVLVSSAGGMWGLHGTANYAAAKGGVYGLGRALALEGREHGIHVNILLPGGATTITANSPVPDYAKHVRAEITEVVGARRQPEGVAPMVTYLASESCTVTGETFSAVGGRFARAFVAVTDGWLAEDPLAVTADDIAERFAQITDESHYEVPVSLVDEYENIVRRLGASTTP
jgi:NAD(P)-dependent dehydrogenase (short-subunit alcohol dehydrogenase family)